MEAYKPCAAMVVTQCIYAALALWSKAAFTGGMSPLAFIVYRQAVATIVLVPVVIAANRRKMKEMMVRLGLTGFSLVFVASLVGATVNQCLYYQGVHLGSSSMATAMTNLIPAITFVMAASVRLEGVDVRRPRSLAKILGTAVCVSGAMAMAFFKGPKLLLGDLHALLLHSPAAAGGRWLAGALFLVGSSSCWSLWLILQVPICKSYVDPLALSAWMCLLSTLQSALLVSFLLPDPGAWRIHSLFELSCCLFSGVFGSGVSFYLQSWCISVRGPLYSAMLEAAGRAHDVFVVCAAAGAGSGQAFRSSGSFGIRLQGLAILIVVNVEMVAKKHGTSTASTSGGRGSSPCWRGNLGCRPGPWLRRALTPLPVAVVPSSPGGWAAGLVPQRLWPSQGLWWGGACEPHGEEGESSVRFPPGERR